MTTPVFDLLVFDWDGTLMDSTAHIVRSIQRACASLDLPVPDNSSAAYVIGLGLTDAMRHVSPGLPEARYADMVDAYRRFFFDPEDDVQLFAGVADGKD